MSKSLLFALILALALPVSLSAQHTDTEGYAANRLVVKLNTRVEADGTTRTVNISSLDQIATAHEVTSVRSLFPVSSKTNPDLHDFYELGHYLLVELPESESMDLSTVISDYENNSLVECATPDFIGSAAGKWAFFLAPTPAVAFKPNDPFYDRQWALHNTGEFPLQHPGAPEADISMEEVWNLTTGDSDIIVAILDSGVKPDHPELENRFWINPNEIPDNGIDDDQNGFVDDARGWNFVADNNQPWDDFGHGTNVAGIIGAEANNNTGYAGVDWNCRLMTLKNLDSQGAGFYSWWAASIVYAADNGARVLNMSEGGLQYSALLEDAVRYATAKGCIVIAPMMNTGSTTPFYPAAFEETIAVGATDTDDERCDPFFWGGASNHGSHIDLVAPGNFIFGLSHLDNSDYSTYWAGTSQATAYVSGTVSILLSIDDQLNYASVRQVLTTKADDEVGKTSEDVAGWDPYHGHGRLNASRAMLSVSNIDENPENPVIEYTLYQNYPNPFNPATTLSYITPESGDIRLQVYDVLGRKVSTLVNGFSTRGLHEVTWNGRNAAGQSVASGVYVYRLEAGPLILSKKMMLIR